MGAGESPGEIGPGGPQNPQARNQEQPRGNGSHKGIEFSSSSVEGQVSGGGVRINQIGVGEDKSTQFTTVG